MGFIHPKEFTYLNTFMIQLAQRYLDNGGPTVLAIYKLITQQFYVVRPLFLPWSLIINAFFEQALIISFQQKLAR